MGDRGRCTFGTRPPLSINMLMDRIYRETKHFRNYKTYRPNYSSVPPVGKFYAAHDQLNKDSESYKVDEYARAINLIRAKGPHSKYPSPATSNQTYGWYTSHLVPADRSDRRFYQPRTESSYTKTESIIRMCNQKAKR